MLKTTELLELITMSAMDSTLRTALAEKAKEITKRELATYAERTASSQRANARARKVLPLGVPSSFQAYDPYPIVVRSAHGPNMTDVDGTVYTDYDSISCSQIQSHYSYA
jgi:glutamate-1-semialdehyde 2,1-aminomutase